MRGRRLSLILLTSLFAASLLAGAVQAASPRLSIITPRGVQRGTETVLTFQGSQLADAEEIFFYQPGLTVTKLEPKGNNQVIVTVKVAADCRLGEHVAQVRTKSGISDYRTFYVGALPAVEEKEPNTDFASPQPIDLNVTVTGVVQNEDVDYFVVEAKKGQRISAEVEGMRLGTALFDPYVAILDTKRFELSAADDTPLVFQDGVASIVAPADGKYIIEVRESAYGGNGNCGYRLHVGTFPRPTAVYPPGGKLGEKVDVKFLGDAAGEITRTVQLPSEPDDEFSLFASDEGGIAPSGNPFRLFEHGNVLEQEPNNSLKEATAAELPSAFNGVIGSEGDVDWFKFAAKKGQVYEVECYARRLRSPLDPVMSLHRADGGGIASNDDSRGPDSYFRFQVPADGEYAVQVQDHLGRGGKDFVYRIEFQAIKPELTLGIPRVERYGQYRQTIFVARGNRFGTLLTASRQNFGGDLVLEPQNLPQGITVVAEPMPASMNVMPLVFEAAADAPIAGKLVDFTARHADEKTGIRGRFHNHADLILGAPGQSIYWSRDVDRLAMAVVEELPFTLQIVQPKVPLVQNGSMDLKIVANRHEGFDEPIRVEFPFRPPGVGAASAVTIPKGQNEVVYPLNANGNAQAGTWKVFALGSANVNGTAWVSSQLATLEIAGPYVQFAMQRTAVEQGQQTQIFCKIQHNKPFEGEAVVHLLGLPNKVSAEDMKITKDTQELAFDVKTDPSSPPGRHKNVFCQVIVTENGEPIVHRTVGGTELRIDKPLPKPTEQPKKPEQVAKKEEPKPPPKKPLSRLEQLRLEAKKRAEAESGGSE